MGCVNSTLGRGLRGFAAQKAAGEGKGEHRDVGQINWGEIATVLVLLQEFQFGVGSVLVSIFLNKNFCALVLFI